jgi:hypothetical protein
MALAAVRGKDFENKSEKKSENNDVLGNAAKAEVPEAIGYSMLFHGVWLVLLL